MEQILILGAGHLSWHLSQVLRRAGYGVRVATNQTGLNWPVELVPYDKVDELAALLLNAEGAFAGAVVIAGRDDAIEATSRDLPPAIRQNVPVIHCSGALPLGRIHASVSRPAVLWPVRSFRRGAAVPNWRELPLVYDAADAPTLDYVRSLAESLSDRTFHLDDERRARLHLAAVFGNNFANHLFQIAYELCAEKAVPFEAILPLIRETTAKLGDFPPADLQTGPAVRNDATTVNRQLKALTGWPDERRLYEDITALIQARRVG